MRYLILLPILFLCNIVSATAQEKVSGVTPIFNTAKEAVAFFDPYGDIKEDIKEQDHKVEDFKNEIKKIENDGTSLEKVLELKKEQKKLLEEEIENRFDKLGIEIPFPHRTLYLGSGVDLNNLNKVSEMTK